MHVTQPISVICSGAFTAAYKQLAPLFSDSTGIPLDSRFGASVGHAADAIPTRFARGEFTDVVIMSEDGLAALDALGWIQANSKVKLVQSRIGLCVQAGAATPDISTVETLKQSLLAARSVAYSASASGTYLSEVLFKQLGADVEQHMANVAKRVFSERVGAVVARGEAQLGFQQISEILPIVKTGGVDFVAPLPDAVQKADFFCAAIVASTQHTHLAQSLIRFLTRTDHVNLVSQTGVDPVGSPLPF